MSDGAPVRVGNDVVDLGHPRCRNRPASDPLFVRILSPSEREWAQEGGPPELREVRLWAHWAAKEAAFKVGCKMGSGAGAFRPRAFGCELTISEPEEGTGTAASIGGEPIQIRGLVAAPGRPAPIAVAGTSDGAYLHLVGWSSGPRPDPTRMELGHAPLPVAEGTEVLASLRARFTSREWEGVHSPASAHVRLLARERIASHLGAAPSHPTRALAGIEILTSGERPGRTPPRVRVGGEDRPEIDLSLSHHGRYVAWAILLPSHRD